jgi:hypothetical protein
VSAEAGKKGVKGSPGFGVDDDAARRVGNCRALRSDDLICANPNSANRDVSADKRMIGAVK